MVESGLFPVDHNVAVLLGDVGSRSLVVSSATTLRWMDRSHTRQKWRCVLFIRYCLQPVHCVYVSRVLPLLLELQLCLCYPTSTGWQSQFLTYLGWLVYTLVCSWNQTCHTWLKWFSFRWKSILSSSPSPSARSCRSWLFCLPWRSFTFLLFLYLYLLNTLKPFFCKCCHHSNWAMIRSNCLMSVVIPFDHTKLKSCIDLLI